MENIVKFTYEFYRDLINEITTFKSYLKQYIVAPHPHTTLSLHFLSDLKNIILGYNIGIFSGLNYFLSEFYELKQIKLAWSVKNS